MHSSNSVLSSKSGTKQSFDSMLSMERGDPLMKNMLPKGKQNRPTPNRDDISPSHAGLIDFYDCTIFFFIIQANVNKT